MPGGDVSLAVHRSRPGGTVLAAGEASQANVPSAEAARHQDTLLVKRKVPMAHSEAEAGPV